MFWRILRVLMWKHWVTRMRKWSCTTVEFVVPILFLLPSFLMRVQMAEVNMPDEPQQLSCWRLMEPVSVFYTPETNFTRALMADVAEKLNLELLNELPDKRHNYTMRGYLPFKNNLSITRYSHTMDPNEVIVVFHDVTDVVPDKLNYSIRMRPPYTKFNQQKAYYADKLHMPHDFAISYQFIRVQWAIDSCFIQMLTGKDVKQEVTLQESLVGYSHNVDINLMLRVYVKTFFIYTACLSGLIPIFYGFMARVLSEKASGVQELMEMMGVTPFPLAVSHILNACVPGLFFALVGTLLMKIGYQAFLEKSSAVLIFLAFFLHFLSLIFTGLVFSYIGRRAPNVAVVVSFTYVFATLPGLFIFFVTNDDPTIINGIGLLISVPLYWIMKEAIFLEFTNDGLQFYNMSEVHSMFCGSALRAFLYLFVQMIISTVLCLYLERVVTGIYGSALPWNFLCQKDYWSKKFVTPNETLSEESDKVPNSTYFEPPPAYAVAGIRAINVTKDYPKNPGALDNLTLDVYQGEITVLLGHNGAGKSTLISVITGMTNPTKGKVLVNGYDILRQKVKARSFIGLCPQYNMFLDYVSVIEHFMFFTLIKRGTFAEARKSAEGLLDQLNIRDKANSDTSQLSGGMKRRVQLGCALAGQASVLLLDEPTAGLDVETRRSLWDLLLSLRGSRTVLLSTHFMEEADALGDRVAALHNGHLCSNATPMYLKRSLGTGYRLTLGTIDEPNEAALTKTVQSVLPNASVKEVSSNTVSYNLPIENTKDYPALFAKLESQKAELGIASISVGVSTLEEVFLKLCSGTDFKPIKDQQIKKAPQYKRLTGIQLIKRQFEELIKRYLRFLWMYKYTQILLGIFCILILLFVTTAISNNSKEGGAGSASDFSSPTRGSEYLYSDINNLRMLNDDNVTIDSEDNIKRRIKMNHSDVVAIVSDDDAKVFYKKSTRNGAGAALNLLSNLIATQAQPRSKGPTITVHNHPILDVYPTNTNGTFRTPKGSEERGLWAFLTVNLVLMGLICMMALPTKEYHSGARASHLMAGCSPELHRGSILLFSIIQVMLTFGIATIIACSTLDKDDTFTEGNFLCTMFFLEILGSLAVLASAYDFTFSMTENYAMGLVAAMNVTGTILIPVLLQIEKLQKEFLILLLKIFVPQYAFYAAAVTSTEVAAQNALCSLNKVHCPETDALAPEFEGKCCDTTTNPISYWDRLCDDIAIMLFQTVIFLSSVFLRQRGLHSMLREKIVNYFYKPPTPLSDDKIIKAEQMYVEKALDHPNTKIKDVMLVSNVHKKYVGTCCCSSYNAVKGVSFSVKKGECFGLLGVNGAGKSTVFQMLTVTHSCTRGKIFASSHTLNIPYVTPYMRSLAYCPQFEGLDEFLTGRQNLSLLLAFKGLNPKDADTETQAWIKLVALEKYSDRRIMEYSGGCKRRMAAAAALCTGAPATLLDEPTAGVDVAARRSVWLAIKRALVEHRSLIITSHSLDEMEILCHRIAIMSAGEIFALGTPAYLKDAFAIGHSVVFNLKHFPDDDTTREKKVSELKHSIESTFKCILKDEHRTMLHYHISETMPYSQLFKQMEDLKGSSSGLIQDYSVSETTLEEVFLSFAEMQNAPPVQNGSSQILDKRRFNVKFKYDKETEEASSTRETKDKNKSDKTDKDKSKEHEKKK